MVYITLDPLKWSLDPSSLSWLQFSQRNDDGRRVVDRDLATYPGEAMVEASVLVVGAGAIGGVTAAKMTGEVRRVAVLDANEEHVERVRGEGLLLDDLGEERQVRIEAHADPAGLEGPFDFALITLKAPYLESALEPLLERGLVETFVSLGNGLVQERIAAIVGEGNLIWGTVEWGATNLGPGHLAQTTRGHFVIGEPEGSIRERTRILAEALGAVDDVGLAQNLELEDVLGVPAESLVVRSAEDRERADEALRIAMQQAGATKASMLQDLERGIKTEVDFINGGVVEKGEEYGVETPLNSRVVELVHAMERGERRPDRDTFGELRELA
jgi:2-dehydropantoate 2-reductase